MVVESNEDGTAVPETIQSQETPVETGQEAEIKDSKKQQKSKQRRKKKKKSQNKIESAQIKNDANKNEKVIT